MLDVHDAPHDIRTHGFCDVGVDHLEGEGLVEVGVPAHLLDHGLVGADILPEPLLGLSVEMDHLLDAHHVVFDEVDHVAQGFLRRAVVHGRAGVVLVPAPVLVPGEAVAQQAAVGLAGKAVVEFGEVGAVVRPPRRTSRARARGRGSGPRAWSRRSWFEMSSQPRWR